MYVVLPIHHVYLATRHVGCGYIDGAVFDESSLVVVDEEARQLVQSGVNHLGFRGSFDIAESLVLYLFSTACSVNILWEHYGDAAKLAV